MHQFFLINHILTETHFKHYIKPVKTIDLIHLIYNIISLKESENEIISNIISSRIFCLCPTVGHRVLLQSEYQSTFKLFNN